jgi:hypothetical protein
MKKLGNYASFFFKLFIVIFFLGTACSQSIPVQAAPPKAAVSAQLPACPFVGSIISTAVNWNNDCVHVLNNSVTIQPAGTLTIQADTIVKIVKVGFPLDPVLDSVFIEVQGMLVLQGTPGHEVIFTSIRDDTYGGDTNGDSSNTTPDRSDWRTIYLETSGVTFENAIVRYSDYGLTVYNPTSGALNPIISHNTFEKNNFGVFLWASSNADITSKISNNIFTGNNYGLGTIQQTNLPGTTTPGLPVTGTSLPELTNNDFNNNVKLPIFLGGSAFPIYSGNTFIGYPTALQRLGIGLGGHFSYTGTWVTVNNMPYVILTDTTIDSGKTISIPEKTIIKFGLGRFLDVLGTLDIQSNQVGKETIFTSLRDDVGGDTNGDGSDTEPLPGDWRSIYLENDTAPFRFSTVEYAQSGLTIYNLSTIPFNMSINNNSFTHNQVGLAYLTAPAGLTHGQLSGNSFTFNTEFPILMVGTAFPAYSNNSFANTPIRPLRSPGSGTPAEPGRMLLGTLA